MAKKKGEKAIEAEMLAGSPVTTRGRIFEGIVIRKFQARAVIEFERTVHVPKYERFYKKKTRLHARLPSNVDVNVGDLVRIAECRPISKLVNFIVLGKVLEKPTKEAKK